MSFGLVQTVAPTTKLFEIGELKDWLRVTHDHDNVVIEGLAKAAITYVESAWARQLLTATWALTLDCFPEIIELPRPPLRTITGIAYLDQNEVSQTVDVALYTVDTTREPGRIFLKDGEEWPDILDQYNAVTVTYTAGYGAAADVPDTVKTAIKMLVSNWFENREPVSLGTMAEIPMGVKALLASNWTGVYA